MGYTGSTQQTVAAVAVNVEGEFSDVELPADTVLRGLYDTIGCAQVDVVALTARLDMWLDDDGMYTNTSNPAATLIARGFGHVHQLYYGTVVFTGGPDDQGDTLGITPELGAHLRELAGQ